MYFVPTSKQTSLGSSKRAYGFLRTHTTVPRSRSLENSIALNRLYSHFLPKMLRVLAQNNLQKKYGGSVLSTKSTTSIYKNIQMQKQILLRESAYASRLCVKIPSSQKNYFLKIGEGKRLYGSIVIF